MLVRERPKSENSLDQSFWTSLIVFNCAQVNQKPASAPDSLNSPAKRLAFEAALTLLEKTPERREAIRASAPREFHTPAVVSFSRPEALLALKNGLEAQAFASDRRVHKSWQKALLSRQPASVVALLGGQSAAKKGLLAEIATDAACSLTFERLVGDLEPVSDDPSVVRFFQGESRPVWLRRVVWAGRLKRALANTHEQSPLKSFFIGLPETWPGLAAVTLARFASGMPKRARSDGHFGLTTVGSLAGLVDLRRRQWLLQHFSMELGPLLATWLRIGKSPWPEDQMAMEAWIARQALLLANEMGGSTDGVALEGIAPDALQNEPADLQEEGAESVELIELVAGDSALFDLDMTDFDEATSGEDSSFRLGDLDL